jgi:hypothetical protein
VHWNSTAFIYIYYYYIIIITLASRSIRDFYAFILNLTLTTFGSILYTVGTWPLGHHQLLLLLLYLTLSTRYPCQAAQGLHVSSTDAMISGYLAVTSHLEGVYLHQLMLILSDNPCSHYTWN